MPDVVGEVRRVLADAADPARAANMQAYMKSAMPYRGVSFPQRRAALKPVLADYQPPDRTDFESTVRRLWDEADFREERYAAIDLCRHRSCRAFQTPESLPLYWHLVVTGPGGTSSTRSPPTSSGASC